MTAAAAALTPPARNQDAPAAARPAPPGQVLQDVPGIGPGLAGRIRDHFGGDDAFQAAVARQDVAAIANVEGVGARRARRIIMAAAGGDPSRFLATEGSQRVWEDLVQRAQAYAGTAAGRDRIALRMPAATPSEAQQRATAAMAWRERVAGWDRAAVQAAFARLRPLVTPRPARSMEHVVVCDEDTRGRLEAQGVDRWVPLAGPDALRHASGLVLVAGDVDLDADNIVHVGSAPPLAELAPEAILSWFRQNTATLHALDALLSAVGKAPVAAAAAAALESLPAPRAVDLETAVEEERARLQADLKRRIGAVSLTGADVLAVMEDRLPAAVARIVADGIREAHVRLSQTVGAHVAVFVPGRPVEVDQDALRDALDRLDQERALQRHRALAAAARTLQPMQERIVATYHDVLSWEADFAWGCLAHDLDLRPARWGARLELAGALHVGLPRDQTAQPVDYHLGGDTPVALLTGANSGGKTTLLETIAQTMVLARFGLPVPAEEATVCWIDALHVITHRRSLDAGAFEAFLRRFIPLSAPGERRFVLADEVEAITELQAAARIIGFFLERLAANDHLGLFVTHMAGLLMDAAPAARVDGIQSTGLDDQGRLIVDRRPVIGRLASSTPELIIERIARGDPDGPWRELLEAVRTGAEKAETGTSTAPGSAPH